MGLKTTMAMVLAPAAFFVTIAAGILQIEIGIGSAMEIVSLAPDVMKDRLPGYGALCLLIFAILFAALILCRKWVLSRSAWATCCLALGIGFTAPTLFTQQLDFIAEEVAPGSSIALFTFYLNLFIGPILIIVALFRIGFPWISQDGSTR